MGQLGKWTAWGMVTEAEDNRENIIDHAWGVLPTFNYKYCCGKRMSQLGLLEGVTSESDYSKFVRHCSIIFLCVRLSSPCHGFKNLTQFQHSSPSKRRGSRKLPNGFMHYSSSSLFHSLSFFYGVLGEWAGEGEKVRGNKQENAEGIRTHRSLIQLQHLEKKNKQLLQHTEAAASCDSSIRITSSLGLHCST